MCLLIVLSRVIPGEPLIVGGNRDERFVRPAVPMTVLRESSPRTLGGRDLKAGGTWMAFNEDGVVVGLTNRPVEGGPDETKRSRGDLPMMLTAHARAVDAVAAFVKEVDPAEYNPAWLLVGDRTSLFSLELAGAGEVVVTELPPGVYVQENRPMDAASNKADHVRHLLVGIGSFDAAAAVARLKDVLADHEIPPPEPTPPAEIEERVTDPAADDGPVADDPAPDAGSTPEIDPAAEPGTEAEAGTEAEPPRVIPPEVRAACVHTPEYGTRWSGVVSVQDDPAVPPTVRYSDGAPCTRPFFDASPLWG